MFEIIIHLWICTTRTCQPQRKNAKHLSFSTYLYLGFLMRRKHLFRYMPTWRWMLVLLYVQPAKQGDHSLFPSVFYIPTCMWPFQFEYALHNSNKFFDGANWGHVIMCAADGGKPGSKIKEITLIATTLNYVWEDYSHNYRIWPKNWHQSLIR